MRKKIETILAVLIFSLCQFEAFSQRDSEGYFLKNGLYSKTGKSAPNSYAVIINGGASCTSNHVQYWNNCAQTYQYLTDVCGYNKDHIYVIMADGMDSGRESMVLKEPASRGRRTDSKFDYYYKYNSDEGEYYYYYCMDGSTLFKNRFGVNTIQAAYKSNIQNVFNQLKNINNIDELFVYVTDHGYSNTKEIALWNNTALGHNDFSQMVNSVKSNKKTILLAQCFSGSFIKYLKSSDNRTVCTAASASNSSWGNYLSTFFKPFFNALAGKDIENNLPINADYNNDGVVSYEEAFVYAKDHDKCSYPKCKEYYSSEDDILKHNGIPRFWSSTTDYRFCRPNDWGVLSEASTYSSNKNVEAMYLLNSTSKIKGGKTNYNSGKYIRLKSGFKVSNGGKLHAEIFDCEAEKLANEDELRRLLLSEEEESEYWGEDLSSDKIFFLSPNPTEGEFTIFFDGETEGCNSVVITDVTGKVVYTAENLGSKAEINLSGKAQGVYIVKAIVNGNVHTEKLILK